MTYSDAVKIVAEHGRVRRASWRERGEWIAAHLGDTSAITKSTASGEHVPFTPSGDELAANDWEEVAP